MRLILNRLWRDSSAVSVVEYGLLVATLSLGIIVGLSNFANGFTNLWLIVDTYTNQANKGS